MNVIDFSPLVGMILQIIAGIILAVVVPWLMVFAQRKLKIQLTQQNQQTVVNALQYAINYGMNKVQDLAGKKGLTVEVKNELIAHATNYAIAQVPQALNALGIKPEQVPAMIAARLGVQPLWASPPGAQPAAETPKSD